MPRFSLVSPTIRKVASTPMSKSPAKHKAKGAGKEQPGSRKTRMQYAALPFLYGEDGEVRVVLVTSRETKRWVIPKGWPMKKLSPNDAASGWSGGLRRFRSGTSARFAPSPPRRRRRLWTNRNSATSSGC
jgi:hypothetical protein